ncbi:MAG: YwaF family protein [Clostridia bacterium]|nr:YwaF family protein [Clostridia bacterium]
MPEIIWGPMFGTVHIVTLVVAVLINVALYFALSNASRKTQVITLFFLSFAGIAAIIFNLVTWGRPWEYLPLHLCSLNAMLLPFAVLTRKKWACNLLLLWSLGSYIALILHTTGGMDQTNLFSWSFVFYYFPHVLEAGIPILLFALKLVDKDHKTIKSTLIITFACYTAIHFINVAINSGLIGPGDIQVNYMFSITPNNPLLQLFWMVIPSSYWYMLLCIPVILLYLGWWYLPELLEYRKHRSIRRAKLKAIDKYYKEYEEEYIEEIIEKDD